MEFQVKIIKHEQTGIHTCSLCPFGTKTLFSIINHVRRHRLHSSQKIFDCLAKRPEMYRCLKCDFQTHLMVNLNKHVKLTHLVAPEIKNTEKNHPVQILMGHNCAGCDFQTHSLLMFMKHKLDCLKIGSGQNNISKRGKKLKLSTIDWQHCEHCSFKTKFNSCLKEHVQSKHSEPKQVQWFRCRYCWYKSISKSEVERHVVRKHTTLKDMHSGHCTSRSKNWVGLETAISQEHDEPKEVKWCEQPQYKSMQSCDLKKPKIQHTEIAGYYRCFHCHYKSKQENGLNLHMLHNHASAREINWYYCEQCPFKSEQHWLLKEHLRRRHAAVEQSGGMVANDVSTG